MSSPPKLILDTNVLRDREFIRWLSSEYHGRVVTSPVAYMEYKRQLINNGREPDSLDKMMDKANITVDRFGKSEANVAAAYMAGKANICPVCNKIDWADTMIFASIGNPPTLLVTYNISDFPSSDRIKTPDEIRKMFGRKR